MSVLKNICLISLFFLEKKPTKLNITHRRFLGCDDYEAHIRVQYPGKDCDQNSDEEEIIKLNAEPTSVMNCSVCSFTTTRLEVMLFHVRCHIKGISSPVPAKRKKSSSPKKKHKRSSTTLIKHITSEDDRANLSGCIDTDTDDDVLPKSKRKKSSATKKVEVKSDKIEDTIVEEVKSEEKSVTDIRQHLLAEWTDSDDDAQDDLDITDISGNKEDDISIDNTKDDTDDQQLEQEEVDEEDEDNRKKDDKEENMDTEEKSTEPDSQEDTIESTDDPEAITTSDERTEDSSSLETLILPFEKLPEVVAPLEKPSEFKENPEQLPDGIELLEEVPENIKPLEKPPEVQPLLEEPPQPSTSIKSTTRVSKDCFDFDEDLEEEESSIIHTAVGRKIPRVIPPPLIEKRKSLDDIIEPSLPIAEDDENRMEVMKTNENREEGAFKDIMESTTMPEIPEQLVKPFQLPKSEVATKLTNPKKRFVKSFEDFELLQNEQRRKEEEEELKKNAVVETVLKQQESNNSEAFLSSVEISKLKTQIMIKLNEDEDPESHTSSKIHKTPRSKILESYRNDIINEEKEESSKVEEEIAEEKVLSPLPSPSKELVSTFPDDDMELSPPRDESLPLNMVLTPTRQADIPSPPQSEITAKFDEAISPRHEPLELSLPPQKSESFFDMSPPVPPKEDISENLELKSVEEEKSDRIDEYFNDFLFDLDKKSESAGEEESINITAEHPEVEKNEEEVADDVNEVHVKCDDDAIDLAIQTNLTNFTKNKDEMSALTTLALVSELESADKVNEEDMVIEEESPIKTPFLDKPEPELVSIDGNLTVVSEKELADAQVEITAEVAPYKKPVTLTNFSMDFSDSNDEIKKSKEQSKIPISLPPLPEPFDIEEQIPSHEIGDKSKSRSKLLERLTTVETIKKPPTKTKILIKPGKAVVQKTLSKPVIISEIVKPVKSGSTSAAISVQKLSSKRNFQDADEIIDTFVIQKSKPIDENLKKEEESLEYRPQPPKKPRGPTRKRVSHVGSIISPSQTVTTVAAAATSKIKASPHVSVPTTVTSGKAKILQQTIITPDGEILQPSVSKPAVADDNDFDINSMPIVLSDQILTPESIENMPILLGDAVPEHKNTEPKIQHIKSPPATIVRKTITPQMKIINKSVTDKSTPKIFKTTPKLMGSHSMTPKLIRQNSFASGNSKHGKFVIVTTPSPLAQTSKYTVGKKPIIKRASEVVTTLAKIPNVGPNEPSGNKIMVLTTPQGQQQRVLLTPAQQKMMGMTSSKVAKTIVKSQLFTKTKDNLPMPTSSGLITKSRLAPSHLMSPLQGRNVRIERSVSTPSSTRKLQMQPHKVQIKPQLPPQKTILIKNQHGQTVRKIQGTDDALLDQQVAQQIEAIKASGVLNQKQDILNFKTNRTIRRTHSRRPVQPQQKMVKHVESTVTIPPLAPISPKKLEIVSTSDKDKTIENKERQPTQLVIEDAQGHQTPINEGQILALPSETIDGQPQSYVLVTVDEAGNLTPLNNEAILSLDQNLNLGGGLTNAVLQIDQSALKEGVFETTSNEVPLEKEESVVIPSPPPPPPPEPIKEPEPIPPPPPPPPPPPTESTGQQLIVTGDPIAAQKFLESLTEGNTDLANILANTEGSILIHADGQQILINTDSDNQMLLSMNTDNLNMSETSEGGGNPIFATQPLHKNQDILAAALADTDVFQQEQNGGTKLQSQLSPSGSLYPMNVPNVLETSLTLNSPIMTPLEVPSTNTKKISDESDILGQIVPKNVDLPITITDPNISQTVSQQQIANELHNNLELSLPISESTITVAATEMNSSSFVYSLPNLDGGVDINQKPFNSSMPILTEEETIETDDKTKSGDDEKDECREEEEEEEEEDEEDGGEGGGGGGDGGFLDESDGLCALGGEMCSSLSEPPPDMFDLSAVLSSHHQMKTAKDVEDELKIDEKIVTESASEESTNQTLIDEDSCEIPVQPPIVTTLSEVEGSDAKQIEVENGEGSV